MPSTYKLKLYERAEAASFSASERFTHALVTLTRTVWHADCTFETASGAICEPAASAMQVERVSVIAEGVEHLDQQHALQAIGVRRMQGWLSSRAMEQGEIRGLFGTQPPLRRTRVGKGG